ncbi:cation:proton antiporter domain-containing protein [Natronomonas sp.]|uniref:cation:proton antiporter domain-containing protein n=1 Tax=Natronomonas sp. TaxID=2184060 RepID=UPI003FA56D65
MIASILVLGIVAQVLAHRLQIPSVLFLILIGLGLGDFGLGLVTLETFGDGLGIVVGLSVAIIVFDGAFHLHLDRFREAETATARLVTVGAVVTFVGTSLAVHYIVGAEWPTALLVGALLVATGPTVITPILEVVRLREHVASALETEGIINDVTAAIAAVVIFEVFVVGDGSIVDGLTIFAVRFGLGIASGLVVAGAVYGVLRADLTPGRGPRTSRFMLLVAAVGSYGVAESFAPEAGIAAAATAGILLGNLPLAHRETMEVFGRDTTLVVLSFAFISLAALIDLGAITALGVSGIGVVVAVALVVRPLVIAISTIGIERFTPSERLFLGLVAPRGIVPASVATLFAVELAESGAGGAAETLLGAVFIVIFATVVIEGGLARQIGEYLGVTPMRTIIVGGGRVGRSLATRLEDRGEFVVIVEHDAERVEQTREAGFTVHHGDGTEADVLRTVGIEDAKSVAATTADDDRNLLVCQLARSKFGVENVYARVNDPSNVAAFDTLDVTAIDASEATALAMDNEIERPAIAHWMTQLGDGHDVQETRVTAGDLVGKTIREVNSEIPDGCIVAVIGRDEDAHVPDADEALEAGDHITFLGDTEAVRRAVKRFHPHD